MITINIFYQELIIYELLDFTHLNQNGRAQPFQFSISNLMGRPNQGHVLTGL